MFYRALTSYANLYLHGDLETQKYDFCVQNDFVLGDISNSKLFNKVLWNVDGQLEHSLHSLASFVPSFYMLLQLHIFHQFLTLQNDKGCGPLAKPHISLHGRVL